MLHFRLFGFPITVHWLFWVVSALLGGATSVNSPEDFKRVLLWVAVVFVSVLWHELGHAFAMRHFGDSSARILLYGGGGLAFGGRSRNRTESIIISFAGPAAGLFLGFVVWLYARAFPPEPFSMVNMAIAFLLLVNIFWSLVNLLPVIPLDGGRISEAVLARRGKLALQISLVCAVAVALYAGFGLGQLFIALLFGMMAVENWRALQGRPSAGMMGHE